MALHAQPTWRFHLAFENGDGARDTIWLVYDTTATLPADPWPGPNVDTALGESGTVIDYDSFNVWMINAEADSTATNAIPYSWFPIHGGSIVDGINWVAPITIRWDTALFHSPYLPTYDTIGVAKMGGTYFFFNNNDPWLQAFNMLLTDSVVVDVDAEFLFPFGVYFGADDGIGINEVGAGGSMVAAPNPTEGLVHISGAGVVRSVIVRDAMGRKLLDVLLLSGYEAVDVSAFADGIYLLTMNDHQNRQHHATMIKQAAR